MDNLKPFSVRAGLAKPGLDLDMLIRLLKSTFRRFLNRGYFTENFGSADVNTDYVGRLTVSVPDHLMITLHKVDLWPIGTFAHTYKEDDVMDLIEFLYEFVSKPTSEEYVDVNNLVYGEDVVLDGPDYYYTEFDKPAGQAELRLAMNAFLSRYGAGFELLENGQVVRLLDSGIKEFVDEVATVYGSDLLTSKVEAAKVRFRHFSATSDEKRMAVRELADVLEHQRKAMEKARVLTAKDDDDLFKIANGFGIRHYNDRQQTDYDTTVWLDWMFFYYLATIRATSSLLKRQQD